MTNNILGEADILKCISKEFLAFFCFFLFNFKKVPFSKNAQLRNTVEIKYLL